MQTWIPYNVQGGKDGSLVLPSGGRRTSSGGMQKKCGLKFLVYANKLFTYQEIH